MKLPGEIPGILPPPESKKPPLSVEEMDFFQPPENRALILEREEYRCFYCLRALTKETYVIEHVVSRPAGDSSYQNVVASCRECNNRKNDSTAEDYMRSLYRQLFLSVSELQDRLAKLARLKSGELRPRVESTESTARPAPWRLPARDRSNKAPE